MLNTTLSTPSTQNENQVVTNKKADQGGNPKPAITLIDTGSFYHGKRNQIARFRMALP